MTPTETQRFAQVVLAAQRGEAIDYQCSNGSWSRISCLDALGWDGDSTRYRIAKKRQSLPAIIVNGTPTTPYIDCEGLHVGCATISFERVKEIAKTCRAWQNGGKEALARVECHVAVARDSGRLGWVQAEPLALGQQQQNYWRDALMREVLPGEEEL